MNTDFPTSTEIRDRLSPLSYAQIAVLSRLSGVPVTTLWKVRNGETSDPRIDTVAQFLPHIDAAAMHVTA
jgi:predicted transcriptional regulator